MANIIIVKDETNIIITTLIERVVYDDSKFLFIFTNKYNNTIIEYVLCEKSVESRVNRFYQFDIVDKVNPDNLINEVNLRRGEWFYSIYEKQEDTLVIEPDLPTLLENGLLIVK